MSRRAFKRPGVPLSLPSTLERTWSEGAANALSFVLPSEDKIDPSSPDSRDI